ncbi:MAG: type II toxin-antitoxin system VapC family toxin [Planctomycetaceae bacterium]|jgi:PIN domain nuclease of toxin-antitoxin system|nr:type II toxin-antitoxin system VapC family toxin [Planctomycetaceae bacterium]
MNYLLDTHIAIWAIIRRERLPKRFAAVINDTSSRKYVSIISIWELAIKINIGKLDFPGGTKGFIEILEHNGVEILPVSPADVCQYATLPLHHRDPFDRILIAAAIARDIALLSCDENILPYVQNGLRILSHS